MNDSGLNVSELRDLKSKLLISNVSLMNHKPTKVFSERGLYMLATIRVASAPGKLKHSVKRVRKEKK